MRRRIDGLYGSPQVTQAQIAALNAHLAGIMNDQLRSVVTQDEAFNRQLNRLPAVKRFRPEPGEVELGRRLEMDALKRARTMKTRPAAVEIPEPAITSGSVLTVNAPPYWSSGVSGPGATANRANGTFQIGVGRNQAASAALWGFFRPIRTGIIVRFAPLFNAAFDANLMSYTFFLWPGSPSRASARIFLGAFAAIIAPNGQILSVLANQKDTLWDRRVSILDSLSVSDSFFGPMHVQFIFPHVEAVIGVAAWGGAVATDSSPGKSSFSQARLDVTVPFTVIEQFV